MKQNYPSEFISWWLTRSKSMSKNMPDDLYYELKELASQAWLDGYQIATFATRNERQQMCDDYLTLDPSIPIPGGVRP